MTSQINPNNIDGQYPVAGQPNNTQGFRDNFTNIKTNFQVAATEITDLENKGVFKSALTGTTLDNNMADNLIYAVKLNDVSYTYLQQTATAGTIGIDYSAAQYQLVAPSANISLSFSNWPATGSEGMVYIDIVVTNTAYTVTLPSAVSVGTTGIQGYAANVITFGATGTYRFAFSSVDSGATIAIYDLNRPLNYYTNTVNIAATTASTSTTSGALIIAGGVGVGGNLYVAGNIIGNIEVATGNVTVGNLLTGGLVSATSNVTGGNILTAGLISATGNITGGNIISGGVMSSAGNSKILSGTAVPAGGTAGAGYLMSSTANLGVFFGSGVPTLSAAQGSLYLRTDGSSTSTRMYVNTTGSTTWTAVTTAS
jgi:hypothetical protein